MLFDSSPHKRLQAATSSLFLGLSLLLAGGSLYAAEATRWYDVEVIIFSQNSQQYRNSETWPVDYDLPQQKTVQELLPPTGSSKQSAPVPFTRLDEQSLQLTAQAERIKAAPDTELLLHLGWRQPGLPEDKAIAVHVDDSMQAESGAKTEIGTQGDSRAVDSVMQSEDSPHRMEGTLKLVLSRYLHIYTDLIYREPLSEEAAASLAPATQQSEIDLFSLAEAPGLSLQPRYQAYHLQQSRRMRSRELHYLDHPLFGMAILVTPYEIKGVESKSAQ